MGLADEATRLHQLQSGRPRWPDNKLTPEEIATQVSQMAWQVPARVVEACHQRMASGQCAAQLTARRFERREQIRGRRGSDGLAGFRTHA